MDRKALREILESYCGGNEDNCCDICPDYKNEKCSHGWVNKETTIRRIQKLQGRCICGNCKYYEYLEDTWKCGMCNKTKTMLTGNWFNCHRYGCIYFKEAKHGK